jgi:hypothetical protein
MEALVTTYIPNYTTLKVSIPLCMCISEGYVILSQTQLIIIIIIIITIGR